MLLKDFTHIQMNVLPKYSIFWYILNTTGHRMKLNGPVLYLTI